MSNFPVSRGVKCIRTLKGPSKLQDFFFSQSIWPKVVGSDLKEATKPQYYRYIHMKVPGRQPTQLAFNRIFGVEIQVSLMIPISLY